VIFSTIYLFDVGFITDAVTSMYPDRVARLIILPVIVVLMQKLIRGRDDKKLMIVISALVATTFSIHMFAWLAALITIFIFFLIDFFVLQKDKKDTIIDYFKLGALSVALTAPALLLKAQAVMSYSDKLVQSNFGNYAKNLIDLGHGLVAVDPRYLILQPMVVGSVALLLVIGLVAYNQKKPYWYYYSWLIITVPLFVMMFPPTATIWATYLSHVYLRRLILLAPFFLLMGATIGPLLKKEWLKILAIAYIFFGIFNKNIGINFEATEVEYIDPIYSYVQQNIPEKSVILSNLWDSYYVTAYTNNYIVSTFSQHMTSNVNGQERREDIEKVLNPGAEKEEIYSVLTGYDVDYVIIRKSPPKTKSSYNRYWSAERAYYYQGSNDNFCCDDRYKLVFENDNHVLYEVK
jgi:hypothetical protein